MRRVAFLFLCVFVCIPRIALASEDVLQVPFLAQKPNYCGPAALAMLANYYGHPVTQDEIGGAIYLPNIGGTLTSELGDYARRFHLWVRQYHGSLDDLRENWRRACHCWCSACSARAHYFVVLGWDSFSPNRDRALERARAVRDAAGGFSAALGPGR